jgi:glycine cleavage system H protein
MTKVETPDDRRYTLDHEWAQEVDGLVTFGITAFAVEQLGDITLVSIDTTVGGQVVAGQAFGTIESVKTLSDLYAPVSGTVVALNTELDDAPELINEDPWGRGWMLRIQVSAPATTELMDAAAYQVHVASSEH